MKVVLKAISLKQYLSAVLLICCMVTVNAQNTQPNDEIWYTSTDSEPVEPFNKFAFGATLNSNTYNDGKGIIKFDRVINTIGLNAFARNTTLTSITIPKTVASIGEYAFAGCSSLDSIKIPDSVTSIGEYAFAGSGLTSIKFPESLASIGNDAFIYCFKLTNVYVNWTDADNIPNLSDSDFPYETCHLYVPEGTINTYSDKDGWKKFKKIKENIPSNEIWYTSTDSEPVEPFNKFAFGATLNSNTYNNGKGVITFDGDLDSIGLNAFLECTSLTSIKLPETITSIKDTAFAYCKNLKNVVLPDFLTYIGNWAFTGCSSLDSIIIPDSVISIGESAFSLCTSLNSIKIPDSVTSIESDAFSNCYSLKSVVLSNLITKIENNVFFNCSSLESIKIPESVTLIGNKAFYRCSKLTSVHVRWTNSSSIVNLDENTFPYENEELSLYIPYKTKKLYKEANYWKSFNNIVEPIRVVYSDDIVEDTYLQSGEDFIVYDGIGQIEITESVSNVDVTYIRDFRDIAGSWQCWYVPFDAPLSVLNEKGLDAAEIAGILLNQEGKTIVAFKKMAEGTTLKGNTPYVVRMQEDATEKNVTLTFTNKQLMQTTEASFTDQSSYENFTFTGNYKSNQFKDCYTLNKEGVFQKMGEGVSLYPMRFKLDITKRNDGPYISGVKAKEFVGITVFGDDKTTGIETIKNLNPALSNVDGIIYDLQGRKVTKLQSGKIYIMNGKRYIAK